jgi:hypothetical protein
MPLIGRLLPIAAAGVTEVRHRPLAGGGFPAHAFQL